VFKAGPNQYSALPGDKISASYIKRSPVGLEQEKRYTSKATELSGEML